MKKIECFKIQLLIADECEFYEISKATPFFQLKCDSWKLVQEPIIIVADPFLFIQNDTLFLFYEEKRLYHNGVIMMTYTKDLKAWSTPVKVLEEHFHLSYPYVFESDGHVYMIPETCADKSIRIYEALNSRLTEFKFVKKLIKQKEDSHILISFSDSSIVRENGVFYLYTTVNYNGTNQLHLFHSDKLMGKYVEHWQSPISKSHKYGRNAGSIIEYGNKFYRVAQDCEKCYGDNIHILEIVKLSKEMYSESIFKENIVDTNIPFYKEGGHQINMVKFNGKSIVATDAKEYHYFLINRILYKLGFYKMK